MAAIDRSVRLSSKNYFFDFQAESHSARFKLQRSCNKDKTRSVEQEEPSIDPTRKLANNSMIFLFIWVREGGRPIFLSFCKNTRSSNLCLALSLNLYGLYPSEHLNCEWFDNAMIYLPQLNTNYFLKQYWVLMGGHQLSVVVAVPDFGKKLNFLMI